MFDTERDGDSLRVPDGCSVAVEVRPCSICPADMDRFSSRYFLLAWPLARRFPSWHFSGRTPSITVGSPRFSVDGSPCGRSSSRARTLGLGGQNRRSVRGRPSNWSLEMRRL